MSQLERSQRWSFVVVVVVEVDGDVDDNATVVVDVDASAPMGLEDCLEVAQAYLAEPVGRSLMAYIDDIERALRAT